MDLNPHKKILDSISSQKIIDGLDKYVTENRKQRIKNVLAARLSSIHLAVESTSDIHNALAAVRTAEALGVLNIHLITPEGEANGIRSVTQGAFHWVNIYFYDHLKDFLKYIKDNTITLAGGVVDATHKLEEVPVTGPLCLLIGNEQRGLTQEVKQHCNLTYKVPMVGMSESLNLSVCASISLYDTTSRKRALLQQAGDLTVSQENTTRAKYYLNSVNTRLVEGLFRNHMA